MHDDWTFGTATAKKRSKMRDEDHETERLREVVIGTRVERFGFVPLAVLGCQHQYRCPVAGISEPATYLIAVESRQHDVENDGVIGVLGSEPQPLVTGQGDVDGKTLGGEPGSQRRRQTLLVIDDQDSHRRNGRTQPGDMPPILLHES